MSKNNLFQDIESNPPSEIDIKLKEKYEKFLEEEKTKRPAWKDQTFGQKMSARLEGLASTVVAVDAAVLAFTPYFFVAPVAFGLSGKMAKNYDEKVNPEKYYELKALERLAIEEKILEKSGRTGRKHALFGGDLFGEGVGEYGKNLNAAIENLAPKVGLSQDAVPKYTSTRESLHDLNPITRNINRVATFATDSAQGFAKSLRGSFNSSSNEGSEQNQNSGLGNTIYKTIMRLLGFSPPEPDQAQDQAQDEAKTFYERILKFLGLGKKNSLEKGYNIVPSDEIEMGEKQETVRPKDIIYDEERNYKKQVTVVPESIIYDNNPMHNNLDNNLDNKWTNKININGIEAGGGGGRS